MIRRFTLENFKSFERAELPLSPLTLLIGPNASGKSNAIEAVEILSWMASGQRLGDFLHAIREEELNVRGTLGNLLWDNEKPMCVRALIDWPSGEGPLELTIELAIRKDGLSVVGESLSCPEESSVPLYEIKDPAEEYGNEIQVAYNNFARGGVKPQIKAIDQQPVFTQLTTPTRFSENNRKSQRLIPDACETVRTALESILFLDPSPRRMRDYSFPSERTLQGDGSNLSAVLYNLVEQGQTESLLRFVRSLPEQDIDGIQFLETPRGEVMVQLQETFGGTEGLMEAALLSDGTLRILSVAAAVHSVPRGALVVIEEIDNGVHPSRARLLLENLQRVAEERDLAVLLTTHNPALQDALPDQSLPQVVACFRDPETGASMLRRLEDLERYPDLVARGSLGDLNTRGILTDFLKDRLSEDERKAKAEAWLEELKVGA